jgi:hypothetical protein
MLIPIISEFCTERRVVRLLGRDPVFHPLQFQCHMIDYLWSFMLRKLQIEP